MTQQLAIREMQEFQKPTTAMDLLSVALTNNAAIDVIERLAALQEKSMLRDAEVQFNQALNQAQTECGRIAPDSINKAASGSKYASYAALDKIVRPIYTKLGFSLSFDTAECQHPETVCVICYLSHRAGHTRKYQVNMPSDGKGAKGGDVMTKTHATGAAMSYGMRYLLKGIFNIAVGEDDTDGNLTNDWVSERLEWFENCRDLQELDKVFRAAFSEAKENKASKVMLILVEAKDKQKAKIKAGAQ